MPLPLADYSLIGDLQTATLVGRDGSIDWHCVPRFDSDACFAALLSSPDNGRWLIAPASSRTSVRRAYRDDSLVLETYFECDCGGVKLIDFMPVRSDRPVLIRIVEGVQGSVPMRLELVLRFGYGRTTPWIQRHDQGIVRVGGPDGIAVYADVPLRGHDMTTVAEFSVGEAQRIAFSLS